MFIAKENYESQTKQLHLDELSIMMKETFKINLRAISYLSAVPFRKNYHAIHSNMFISDTIVKFCEKYQTEGWSCVESGQNWYLLYKGDKFSHVYKIRCEPEIDLQKTLRRTNRSKNSDIYITNDAIKYLNEKRGEYYKNPELRELLIDKYPPNRIHFFFLTWSENYIGDLKIGTLCQDGTKENIWYFPLSYSTLNVAENQSEKDISCSHVSNKADVVKPKIKKDVIRKRL